MILYQTCCLGYLFCVKGTIFSSHTLADDFGVLVQEHCWLSLKQCMQFEKAGKHSSSCRPNSHSITPAIQI